MAKKLNIERGYVGKRFPVSPTLLTVLESILLTFVLEILSRKSLTGAFWFMVDKPLVFLFNVCMVAVTISFAMLFRKKILSLLLITAFWLAFGITNCVLLSFRSTMPLTAVDLQLGLEAIQMIDIYFEVWQIVLIAAAVVAGIVFIIVIAVKSPKYRHEGQAGFVRFLSFTVTFLVCSMVMFSNPNLISRELRPSLYDSYLKYGFPYCFTYSFFDIGISKPEGYSEDEVDKIVQESELSLTATEGEADEKAYLHYPESTEAERTGSFENQLESYTVEAVNAIRKRLEPNDSQEYDNLPNIVFMQLESFFDPTTINGLTFSQDPIPNFRRLKETGSTGLLYVPTVAGGTANTEFEVLTGCSLDYFGAGEFPYYSILKEETCESLAIDLRALDYHATAIHNYTGSFYYRNTVYDNMGFNNFISREYMEGYEVTPMGWPKDAILQKKIRETIDSTEGKDFIYCVAVQSHGRYIELPDAMQPHVTVEGYEDESDKKKMEYFLYQVYEVDQVIGSIVEEYSDFDEDIMIVFFGDHLPGLNLTPEMLTTGDLYATEYVIWSNYDLEKADKNLETYQLGAHALGLNNIDTGTMLRFHQTQMGKETYEYNLEILEYDMLYGDKIVYAGRELGETGEMMMGLAPITITNAYVKNEDLFIEGENFTSASLACFGGDENGDTIFIHENLLVVPDTMPEDGTILTIGQISGEGFLLSESEPYECVGLKPIDYSK